MARSRRSRRLAVLALVAAWGLASGAAAAAPPAAGAPEEVVEIYLDLVRTEVEPAGQGWEVVQSAQRSLGLSELQANMNAVLGNDPFAPGAYDGLRLILGERSFVRVRVGGAERDVPLFVPSGGQTGLKLDEPFEVVEGKLLQLEVAFDETALRHEPRQDRYTLRPTCLSIVGVQELDAVATVGPEGGSLTTLDGRVELTVPPDALDHRETLSIRRLEETETPPPMPPGAPVIDRIDAVGPAYELTAGPDLSFSVPAALQMHYVEEDVLELDEFELAVHVFDEATGLWLRLATTLDHEADSTLVELSHFSTYRLMANANGLILGPDDLQVVDSGLQQLGGFGPTQAIGFTGSCTGFLISNNLFMTNHHCLTTGWCGSPGAGSVSFNRIIDPLGSPQAGEPSVFLCSGPRLLLPDQDVAVVELQPDAGTGKTAGEIWGYYTLDPAVREARTYTAGFPANRVLAPNKLWIDRLPGCGVGILSPLEAFFWHVDFRHGCDTWLGSDGSPIVDFQNRNRVIGIHRGAKGLFWWVWNVGTYMASVIPFDDVNGNFVLDMVEIDLTGSLTNVGFRTCVPGLDGPCIVRWFLGYSIEFTARGGVPPYTWSASGLPGGVTLSSGGVLTGPPPFCLCDLVFPVTVTDSLGVSTTRNVVVRSGL